MQLGRYQLSSPRPEPVLSVRFSQDGRFVSVATEKGYEIWCSFPLGLVRRRELRGTLAQAIMLPFSPLLVLQGGGSNPVYPPNKAVVYHDKLGVAVAELEFGERVRGIAVRHGAICVALARRVLAYQYGVGHGTVPDRKGKAREVTASHGFWLEKLGEWETAENVHGLLAISTAPYSALLALPGRQAGHVQLVHLPPCPAAPSQPSGSSAVPKTVQVFRSPIVLAHTHALSTLSCTASGSHIATTSERGTLVRIWDTARGSLERELRRGVDPAGMWGAVFEPPNSGRAPNAVAERRETEQDKRRDELRRKGGRLVGWSDKGTVHVWGQDESTRPRGTSQSSNPPNLTNLLARKLPLPRYFSSTTSSAQYRLPRKNPHAINSYVSAAAGAYGVGVPSMKIPGPSDESADDELAERFVVGWVEVDVEVSESMAGTADPATVTGHGVSRGARLESDAGPQMGSRTERGSRDGFGSTRGGTPTPRFATPVGSQAAGTSAASSPPSRGASHPSQNPRATGGRDGAEVSQATQTEMQLVAITYSGDWYRLRIPDEADEGDAASDAAAATLSTGKDGREREKKRRDRCELVEYRRINVGGGGW